MNPPFDIQELPSPSYIIDEGLLETNLRLIQEVQKRTGATIILALKGFAMFPLFPAIRRYLAGTTASSLDEARLGYEEFGGEVHAYAPAFSDWDMENGLLGYIDHINFNSFSQWRKFKPLIGNSRRGISCGLRVNPEYSEVEVELYNPCAPQSRLGIPADHFAGEDLSGIEGLHFHTMCEQNSDTLERTLRVFEKKFGAYLDRMKWVNFGGGHHITRPDYNVDLLCDQIISFREKYGVHIYLEPGEAVALNTGFLVATVLDIIENNGSIAILDTSATAHMPDVIEMPYRPEIAGAGPPGKHPYTYRLGGLTCLAGDVIGDYSFPQPLTEGSRLVFRDMAHYTMVKNNTFNGVRLPSIGIHHTTGETEIVRTFTYHDYRDRLG